MKGSSSKAVENHPRGRQPDRHDNNGGDATGVLNGWTAIERTTL